MSAAAMPAYADTVALPPGDALYASTCTDDVASLYSIDAATAFGTKVGTDSGIDGEECAGGAAYDRTTGKSYYLSYGENGELAVVNVATGAATGTGITGDSTDYPDGLAIGNDGKAYVISGQELYSIDLVSAVTTDLGRLDNACLYAFAVDPTSGQFYGISCNSGDVYQLDVATHSLTSIGSINTVDTDNNGRQDIYSLQIDSAGTWWFEANNGEGAALWSTAKPAGTAAPVSSGNFRDVNDNFYTESLLITRPLPAVAPAAVVAAPALAETGVSTQTFVGFGASALALFAAGVAMLVVARNRRRSLTD